MTKEELKAMGEKIAKGTATEEEKVAFLEKLNSIVSDMKTDISSISSNN